MIILLMGVSGSGKSTIGRMLAERTGWVFADADDYHPEADKQKMALGLPLTDEDRAPWLAALNHLLLDWQAQGINGILACSALKEAYRITLTRGLPEDAIRFVLLHGPRRLIAERLRTRHHEFMNPGLLDSQIATLELPEGALRVSIDQSEEAMVNAILAHIA